MGARIIAVHLDFIIRLNPELDWNRVRVGTQIRTTLFKPFEIPSPVGQIQIRLSERILQVHSPAGYILFHCTVSIARRVENRPTENSESWPLPQAPATPSIRRFSPASPKEKASKAHSSSHPAPTIQSAGGILSLALTAPNFSFHNRLRR